MCGAFYQMPVSKPDLTGSGDCEKSGSVLSCILGSPENHVDGLPPLSLSATKLWREGLALQATLSCEGPTMQAVIMEG